MTHPGLGYTINDLDITDKSLYSEVMKPFGESYKLPTLAYQSKTFSDLEDENIWSRMWVAIGSSEQIPNSGDMLPFTIGHHGIHVQRLNETSIIGRFNKAQHGGCRAIPAQCQTGNKTKCSFTSCGFSRDRDPINNLELEESNSIAHQYLGVVPERLLKVNTYQLGSYIFVNIDPEETSTPDFELPKHVTSKIYSHNYLVHFEKFEADANWKLICNSILNILDLNSIKNERYNLDSNIKNTSNIINFKTKYNFDNQSNEFSHITWISPNIFFIQLESFTLSLIIQSVGLQKTSIRILISKEENTNITEKDIPKKFNNFIEKSIQQACDIQKEINTLAQENEKDSNNANLTSIIELSSLGDYFNKSIAQSIFNKHEFYWNVPLFKNIL